MISKLLRLSTLSARLLLVSCAAAAQTNVLFSDNFNRPDGLVTNEYAYWKPTAPGAVISPDWNMTSGSFFIQGDNGWTGVPDNIGPNATSSNGTDSAVFRLTTVKNTFNDVSVSFGLLNQGLSTTATTPAQTYDGCHVMLRYQSEYNLYYVSVNRRDNTVIIKKKVAGGTTNGGTYYSLTSPVSYSVPYNTWQQVQATVKTNSDGSVTLQLFFNGSLKVSVVDNGTIGGPPITSPGQVGIRGDNANLKFSNFVVANLDGSAPAPTTAPSCLTSAGTWQNSSIPSQTGSFTASFDATPASSGMDAVTGLSNGAATGFSSLATIVRFKGGGTIDARNGGSYAAATTIPYTAGATYHFRLTINVPSHTYSAYVTPPGSAEQLIGSNFAFRTEQASVASLSNIGLLADIGSETACNLTTSATTGNAPAPTLFDDFSSYTRNSCMTDGTRFGPWNVAFSGYGCTQVGTDGYKDYLQTTPQVSVSPSQTHASLVLGPVFSNPITYTMNLKTVAQLRQGSAPNPWEVGWVLWHYTDNDHFYSFYGGPAGWSLGKQDPAYPGSQRFLASGTSPTFPVGTTNAIKIVENAQNTISVYVNGQLLATFTDTERPYTSGNVGIYEEDSQIIAEDVAVNTTPPLAMNSPAATGLQAALANINWTTNAPADSQVQYGLTSAYGNVSGLNTSLVTNHSVTLAGLSPSTVYHYRVLSRLPSGYLAASPDNTFTTPVGIVAVTTSGGLDKLGVQEIYPTVTGGKEWFNTWGNGIARTFGYSTDPQDPWFDANHGNASYSVDGKGLFYISGSTPRMYIHDPAFQNEWHNVEMTVYAYRVADSSTPWGGIEGVARSNHATYPAGISDTTDLCDTRGIDARFRYDGHIDFEKETSHPHSVAVNNKTMWPTLPYLTWIGYKLVVYDLADGNVKLESWMDMTDGQNGGNWVKVNELIDDGTNFGVGGVACASGIDPALRLTNSDQRPGSESGKPNITVYWRSDNVATNGLIYKKMSVREINPTANGSTLASFVHGGTAPSAKAPQKFLTPARADGINDAATFGAEADDVSIFDIKGRRVFHGTQQGGPIVWNGKDDSGRIVESGIYIAKIRQKDSNVVYQSFAVAK